MTVLILLCGSYLHEALPMGWHTNWTNYLQADKLQTLIKAAGVDDVEPIWTSLFAKVRNGIRQYWDVGM